MASVTKRGSRYSIVVSMGYDMAGKKIRKTTTFVPPPDTTEKRALKLANDFARDFERRCQGATALNQNMRFSELSDWYFENYAPNQLKDITAYNYKSGVTNHILPVLGNAKLKDITTAKVTEFFKGLPLSPASSRKVYIILSSIFTCGVKQGFILSNPCKNAILPKNEQKEKAFLDESQARELLSMLTEYSQFNTIIKVLLYTGMRSGECLALQWDNIDFDSNIIHIEHTLTDIGGHKSLTAPKTYKSIRSIKVSDDVMSLLKLHRAEQEKEVARLGELYKRPEMVFTSSTGDYMDRSGLNTKFRKFVKDSSFSFLTLHGLRHCNATLLINSGIPIKVVSEHLGHCDIGVTANIYSHVLETSKAKAADVLSLKLG